MLQHRPASLRASAERADARANRARLISAAREVLRERGPDAEMKEIAERAGLGVGTIYRNFPTKDDLILALVMELAAEVRAVLEDAAALDDSVAALRHVLRGGCAIVERHGDLMAVLMSSAAHQDRHKELPSHQEQFEPIAALLEGIIRTGVERGRFRAEIDPGVVAAQIKSAFTPWTYQELRRTRTPDQIADACLGVLLRGIRAG